MALLANEAVRVFGLHGLDLLLHRGWWGPEVVDSQVGYWMGPESSIVLSAANKALLRMSFRVRGLVESTSVVLRFFQGSELLLDIDAKDFHSAPRTLYVCVLPGDNYISVKSVGRVLSPKMLGMNDDSRLLAAVFFDFSVDQLA